MALDFAELAYDRQSSGKLRRINGAVFSALCGHRPPFCCAVALNCRETLENYVRYPKERKVLEAPMVVSCDPYASYVGGSLRFLKIPDLDPITKVFQNDFGFDAKPFMEMLEACRRLCGTSIALRPKQCTCLPFCNEVSAEVHVCDFSRGFVWQESDVMCIMGQVILRFHAGDEVESVRLPSKRLLLTVAPFCKKGSPPRIKGTPAYLKRRYERRPNVNYVTMKDANTLECCILCQDESKRRSLFYMEAETRPAGEDKELQLHFMVRVPMRERAQNAAEQRRSKGKSKVSTRIKAYLR